jgi:hypothetical protein
MRERQADGEDDETERLLGREEMGGSTEGSATFGNETNIEDLRKESIKALDQKRLWAGGLSYTALLVIMAEFAERCCYYAITAIFVVYSGWAWFRIESRSN